jgi:hypothetical protein
MRRLICTIIFGLLATVTAQVADGNPQVTGHSVAQAQTAPVSSSSPYDEEDPPPPPLNPPAPIVIPPAAPAGAAPAPAPANGPIPATAGTRPPAVAGDAIFKMPNYNLVGVVAVVYSRKIHGGLFSLEDECNVDWTNWDHAIAAALTQSAKLKFIPHAQYERRRRELNEHVEELTNKITSMKTFDEGMKELGTEWNQSRDEANKYNAMPELRFVVITGRFGDTCVAKVEGSISAATEGAAKYMATGQDVISAGADMWSSHHWLKVPHDKMSALITKASLDLLNSFLDEWTHASCLGPSDLMCKNP